MSSRRYSVSQKIKGTWDTYIYIKQKSSNSSWKILISSGVTMTSSSMYSNYVHINYTWHHNDNLFHQQPKRPV